MPDSVVVVTVPTVVTAAAPGPQGAPGAAASALDDLTDVSGATAATTGQILVKQVSGQWQPAAIPVGSGYTHSQVTPAASWSGTHGLGRYPQAMLLDTAGRRVIADLEFPTVNTYSVTHAEPLAGALYLL